MASEGAAASPSSEGGSLPPSGDAAPEFEHWLLDENGDPVELYTDPVAFADSLRARYRASPSPTTLLQENLDAMDAADAESAEAKAILDEFTESDAGSAEDTPRIAVVEVPVVRGAADWKTYMTDFKFALGQTTADTYLDWIATQHPTLANADKATRLHLTSAAVKQANALSVPVPAILAASAAGADKDEQSVINLIAELKDIQDPHLVTSWMSGMVKVALRDRLTREGKQPLVQRLLDAQAARLAELRGSA